jgi:hypothetical protein
MARPRQRTWLDIGLRLDINCLLRAGLRSGLCKVRLGDGRETVMDVHLDEPRPWWGWLRLHFPGFNQRIDLTAVARHFGGRQWYWLCPMTGEKASVLWMPMGRNTLASQRYWKERRAAYRTQFLSRCDRAHLGIKRIEAHLGKKEDDDALYKPKWQRVKTFNRYCEKIDRYENVLDERLLRSLGRIMARR